MTDPRQRVPLMFNLQDKEMVYLGVLLKDNYKCQDWDSSSNSADQRNRGQFIELLFFKTENTAEQFSAISKKLAGYQSQMVHVIIW